MGQWSMSVSANWRIVFRFADGEAVDIDLVDYHLSRSIIREPCRRGSGFFASATLLS